MMIYCSYVFLNKYKKPNQGGGQKHANVGSMSLEKYNRGHHRKVPESSGTGKRVSMAQDSIAWERTASGLKTVVEAFLEGKYHQEPLLLCALA